MSYRGLPGAKRMEEAFRFSQNSVSPSSSVRSGLEDWQSCVSGFSSPDNSPPASPRGNGSSTSSTTPARGALQVKMPGSHQTSHRNSLMSPASRHPPAPAPRLAVTAACSRMGVHATNLLEALVSPFVISSSSDSGISHTRVLQPPVATSVSESPGSSVVLVHDFGASSLSLLSLAERLVQTQKCKVLLVDLYGFGKSAPPRGLARHLTPDTHVKQLQDQIVQAGLHRENLILVGHGMGASLCLQVAACRKDTVSRLVLIDPSCLASQWSPEETVRLLIVLVLSPVVRALLALTSLWFYAVRGSLRASVGIDVPDVVSHVKGFMALAAQYPKYGLMRQHVRSVKGVSVCVCRTGGLVFSAGVDEETWGANACTVREGWSDGWGVGMGLEKDGEMWYGEEWYSDEDGEEGTEAVRRMRQVESKSDSLHQSGRYLMCLDYLESVAHELPSPATRRQVEILWRLARAYHQVAYSPNNNLLREEKQSYVSKGLATAFCAVQADGGSANAHMWYGVLLSRVGEFEGRKAAVLNLFEARDHLARAQQINSRDAMVHYRMGEWCLSVADIRGFSRWWTSNVFAEPPSSSHTEALSHFLRAEEEETEGFQHAANRLCIVKCFDALGQGDAAEEWLERLLEMRPMVEGDAEALQEAQRIKRRWDWARACLDD